RRAPDVPVLCRQRGPRLCRLAPDVVAGRGARAVPGAPGPGAGACLRLAVAGRPAVALFAIADPVEVVAPRPGAGDPAGAVRRPGLVAGGDRVVCVPEHRLPAHRRVPARART